MRVFVYFNLHKRCWSVKSLEGHTKGRVVAHATQVMLRGCEFKVSEAGRQRVLRTGRKSVHAGVVGTLEAMKGETTLAWGDQHIWLGWLWSESWTADDRRYARYAREQGIKLSYNPHKGPSFVITAAGPEELKSLVGAPLRTAPMVFMNATAREVLYFDPCNMPEEG